MDYSDGVVPSLLQGVVYYLVLEVVDVTGIIVGGEVVTGYGGGGGLCPACCPLSQLLGQACLM